MGLVIIWYLNNDYHFLHQLSGGTIFIHNLMAGHTICLCFSIMGSQHIGDEVVNILFIVFKGAHIYSLKFEGLPVFPANLAYSMVNGL